MPNYTNAVAATSQAHTYAASLTLSYNNIALIPGIPHKYQIEVERIFTTARAGSPTGIVAFQSDASVPVEQKRDVYIIPETLNNNTYLTFNETAKTITIAADLSTLNKVYTNPSNTIYVPNIVAGQVITFRRKTISNTPLVTWSSGTKLTSNQLNLETTQLLYLVQEVLDRVYRQISISGDIVSQIADNAITTSKIVDLNVTTDKINNLAITDAKLASDSVTTNKILNSNVTTAKIADYNITPAKLINTTQAWSLTGTLALTDLATSATGDKVANKNYVLDRVSKYGIITKDSTVTSNVLDTPPSIPSDANDDISLQSGGIWFNPRDGGLRVRVLDKWVRVTGTPLNITDYISTNSTEQTKTGILNLHNPSAADSLLRITNGSTGAGYGQGFAVGLDGTGTSYLWNEENKNTLFGTNGLERVRIGNDGNVAIGNASAAGNTSRYLDVYNYTTGASASSVLRLITHNTTGSPSSIGQLIKYQTGGFIIENTDTNAAANIAFHTGTSERVRIDSSGNVGINTNNPSSKLHVNGIINFGDASAYGQIYRGGSNESVYNSWGGAHIFNAGGTERSRIDNNGSILMGHTTAIGGQGGPRGLTIYTPTSSSNYMWFTGGNPYLVYLESKEAATTGYLIFINQSGNIVGSVRSNGGNTTSYNTTSDYRLKSNISPITNSLTKISSLKPCSYSWLSDNSFGEGFIAHELQEVIPHAVSGKKDAINKDGSIDPQQVDLSKIIPVLTAAVQELKTIVEEQAKRISVLEGK